MKKILVIVLLIAVPFLICSCTSVKNGEISIKRTSRFAKVDEPNYKVTPSGGIILNMSEGPKVNYNSVNFGTPDPSFDFKSLK